MWYKNEYDLSTELTYLKIGFEGFTNFKNGHKLVYLFHSRTN